MTINKILAFDALACALMGLILVLAATPLATLLALPHDLLFYGGLVLFPIALFMAALARQDRPWVTGVWLVVFGNAAWVLASLAVPAAVGANLLGIAFLIVQASAVALLAYAEARAVSSRRTGIA